MEAKRMSEDEIAAVAALEAAVPAGPWEAIEEIDPDGFSLDDTVFNVYPPEGIPGPVIHAIQDRHIADFVANARTTVPKLLAHVAALEAELALYRSSIDSLPLSAQDDVTDAMAALRTERDRDHG